MFQAVHCSVGQCWVLLVMSPAQGRLTLAPGLNQSKGGKTMIMLARLYSTALVVVVQTTIRHCHVVLQSL